MAIPLLSIPALPGVKLPPTGSTKAGVMAKEAASRLVAVLQSLRFLRAEPKKPRLVVPAAAFR
jgi:hypothetical protein